MAKKLGTFFDERGVEQRPKFPEEHGVWDFDGTDYLLYALLCDNVYCPELLWEDPVNRDAGGAYEVRDYQFPLFRVQTNYAGFACARSTGKTESIKAKGFTHTFRRMSEDKVLSAPELIHLLPLTDAIESRIQACRLTREFLDVRAGKTGFTHRPFGVNYLDGTAIIGRIPRLTGTGVKGMHAPDVTIDEGQDYPEKGWTEIHEVVMKDHVDADGNPDFLYEFYGVHSGARDTGFYKRATQGGFKITQITALQRPGWSKSEKEAAKAAYGGTSSPDYRRNIYGEPGAAASPLFVSARLIACMDQDRESVYNQRDYVFQEIRAEEFDELMMPIADVLDLPSGLKAVWAGMDLGLTISPTVILLFSEEKVGGVMRLKLVRRFHLHRMRTRQIRHALYAIGWHYGEALKGLGIDETGIGFPLFQEMEDDEQAPPLMMARMRGYFFNSLVPVGVAPEHVTKDSLGNLRDQYGSSVTEVELPDGTKMYVVKMPMIEASTRYLREFVDKTFIMFPFDPAVIGDMQGDTAQRLKRIVGLKNKPNAYHILDAMRGMAMAYKADEVDAQLAFPQQQPVLELSYDD